MDKIKTQLQENYEDALFALLMDDYAQAEGKRLYAENEKLKNDPAFELPDGMEERGIKAIRKAFRKKKTRSFAKASGRMISRVAVMVLALNIAFGVSFFSAEAFRVEVLNMALNYQETHTTIKFKGEEETPSSQYSVEDLQNIIPDSYYLDSYEETPDGEYALFVGPDGKRIMWDSEPIVATVNLDTEDADYVENIYVDGYDGIVVEKNGLSTVMWGDTSAQRIYSIIADMTAGDLIALVDLLTK